MSSEIYQLKISLDDMAPKIWRRIAVNANVTLPDLHKIIQTTMGWTNSHLHHFMKDDKFYSYPTEDNLEIYGDRQVDYSKVILSDLVTKEKDTFLYEYDFGDCWIHTITLEKISNAEENVYYPLCLDGKRNCPPEDCGGSCGYFKLLKVIHDPKDEEHESMMEWIGSEFDHEYFDRELINMKLQKNNYGCITLF